MGAVLYPLFTLFYCILFWWGLRSFRESSFWGTSWLLFIMVALLYDNLILTIGQWIGTGDTLEVLSLLRYLLKVFLTPTFVFIAWDILRRLQVEWAEYLSTRLIFNFYTLAVTIIGVYTEILWITLEPSFQFGVLQYIPHDHHVSFVIFLTVIPLLIAGSFLWRRNQWPILMLGTIGALGLGVVALIQQISLLVAIAEFLIIFSLVLTELKLRNEDFY
jgi:hypothetical protein